METILPLDFFEDSGAVTVSGNADIGEGGSGRQLSISMGKEIISRPVVAQGADSAKFNLKVGVIPVSVPEDEKLWQDVKLKTMPNSAARVAFNILAAAVFAALIIIM